MRLARQVMDIVSRKRKLRRVSREGRSGRIERLDRIDISPKGRVSVRLTDEELKVALEFTREHYGS